MQILIVEDDPGIADVLEYSLRAEGHVPLRASSASDALALLAVAEFIILDVGLPDRDGFDLCREIRQRSSVPIIFLTARSEEIDRVVGLEIGADDYILKPFSPRELIARIKAVRRRLQQPQQRSGQPSDEPMGVGLVLDRPAFSVTLHGRPIGLSRTEFDLLELLASRPGQVFTRSQILDHAWPDGGCVTDRTVDAHIKTVRKKLAPADCIETIRGVGYRFRAT